MARLYPFQSLPKLPCGFRTITGIPCLSCGGTRSAWALVRLDLERAFVMNPLVAVCGLLAGIYVIHAAMVLLGRRKPWVFDKKKLKGTSGLMLRLAVIGVIVLNWGYLIYVGR